jgi:acetone carboxylase alpha subunit
MTKTATAKSVKIGEPRKGLGRGGITLKEQLLHSEKLLTQTGRYYGIERLSCKEDDPIKYELFHSRLLSTLISAREVAKMVSASPMVRDVGELCFTLYTPEGDSIVLSTGIVAHVHTMSRAIKWMIEQNYEDDIGIAEGTYFANNDTFIGGIHVPDIMDLTPIFHEDEVACWVGGVTHVLECGSLEPGAMPASAWNRFVEGKMLCCRKVATNDTLFRDYEIEMERTNRAPIYWLLDERARMSGCVLVRNEVKQIIADFGIEYFSKASRELIEEARLNFKKKVKALLRPGKYRAPAFYDNPFADKPVPVQAQVDTLMHGPLEMTVTKDGEIILDFDGSSKWGLHPNNCTQAAMDGGLFVAVTQMLAYDGKVNDGSWLACKLNLPYGSWANPDTIHVATACAWMMLIPAYSAFFRCMSQALYSSGFVEEVLTGAANTGAMQTGGTNQYGRQFGTMVSELVCCGSGARGIMDGIDAGYAVWNPQSDMGHIETWEQMIPQVYLGRRIRPDSGGFGKFRGGNGFEALWMNYYSDDVTMGAFTSVSRVHDGMGMFGGYPGAANYKVTAKNTNMKELIQKQEPLPHGVGLDPKIHEAQRLVKAETWETDADAAYAAAPFGKYDLYSHFYLGSSGYGDPLERDPLLALEDYKNEHTSLRTMNDIYGIVLKGKDQIDVEATRKRRDEIRAQRKSRGIPVKEFKKAEREKILSGNVSPAVKLMYQQSMALSKKFTKAFNAYWNLPDEFSF